MKQISYFMFVVSIFPGLSVARTPNVSFKVGGPVSTSQLLLRSSQIQGRTVVPTLGLSYVSVSSEIESRDLEFGDSDRFDFTLRLFIPRLGVRVLRPQVDSLRSYFTAGAFTVIPVVDGSELSASDKKDIKDRLDLLGFTVGWGVEYFFSPRFSVGGEASLNWILHDSDFRDEYWSAKTKTTITGGIARLTFNFYSS